MKTRSREGNTNQVPFWRLISPNNNWAEDWTPNVLRRKRAVTRFQRLPRD